MKKLEQEIALKDDIEIIKKLKCEMKFQLDEI